MQRRLRNTLAIAIAGGAVILGAGTAFAASPADDVTGSAPQVGSSTDDLGSMAKGGDKGKPTDGLNTDELGGSAPNLGSATDLGKGGGLPTEGLSKGVEAPGLGGLGK